MPRIGIRQLKNDASEIIRAVREQQTSYVVTYRGEPVAVILPVDDAWRQAETAAIIEASRPGADFWAQWDARGREIEASWQSDKTAVELVAGQRRDL